MTPATRGERVETPSVMGKACNELLKNTCPSPLCLPPTQWVACLQHEALNDAVEDDAIVVAIAGMRCEVLNGPAQTGETT